MRGVGQNGLNPRVGQGSEIPVLEIEDWLGALIDPAIGSEDQESIESTGEPSIVGDREDCAFIVIEGNF
jgi:hypothetical protein